MPLIFVCFNSIPVDVRELESEGFVTVPEPVWVALPETVVDDVIKVRCWAYEPACEYLYPKKWVFLNNRDMCAQSWAHAIHFSEKYTNLEEFWNTFRQKIFIYPKLRENSL